VKTSEELLAECMVDWTKGYKDCEKGIAHREGQSSEYDRGYGDAYQAEAIEGSAGR
tara:strand:+ start:772 stop:939 length:168 start_codon:yes stop_codon:yes gene_type:complete